MRDGLQQLTGADIKSESILILVLAAVENILQFNAISMRNVFVLHNELFTHYLTTKHWTKLLLAGKTLKSMQIEAH